MRCLFSFTIASALSFAPGAGGQAPLVDTGFSPATPHPDPDLVIVRERAYGAGGVDLTAYGIETAPVDFVQSIYFRFFVDTDPNYDSVAGRVVFPAPIRILGFITGESDLGGSVDDGAYTGTDAIFGVGSNPDDYSEVHRGFECCGTAGFSEFVCKTSDQSFVFGLNVQDGIDDFRVIIDYGSSFPPDLAFDVGSYDLTFFGGAVPSQGWRIGDVANPSVLGSGDFGEVGSITGIPLTSSFAPTTGCHLPVDPFRTVWMIRDTTGAGDTFVDSFDVDLQLPGPERFTIDGITSIATPAALAAGPDNLLYAIGTGNGYAVMDPRGNLVRETTIQDLPGTNVDMVGVPGARDMFIARDTSTDSHVDVLDIDLQTFVQDFVVPQSIVANPVGIAVGSDSMLYMSGQQNGFARIDPSNGNVTDLAHTPPGGVYVDLTGRAGSTKLYLVRDTATSIYIDVYDFVTGTFTYASGPLWASSAITDPTGITVGPDDRLYVIGAAGTSGPRGLVAFDADTGAVLFENTCMNFSGTTTDIAFAVPTTLGVYCTAKLNSQGCLPRIGFAGSPSASSGSPFDVSCINVLNNKSGIFFYGFGPSSAPFQGGSLCVHPPIHRLALQNSGGNPPPDDCSGVFHVDFNARIQSGADLLLVPCTTVYCQYWYRDAASPSTTGLSDGLSFEIQR